MKEDIKNLWVKALRSGEFQQGSYALNVNEKYCVLGILCALALINGICDIDSMSDSRIYTYDDSPAKLPESVIEWAELKSDVGAIPSDFITLQGYNDTFNYDFDQLADIIEENWENM